MGEVCRDGIQDDLDNKLKTYLYRPLEGQTSIRVLQLYPNPSRLECSIRHINLSDGGYQALSYEWGPQDSCFHIHVQNDEDGDEAVIPLTTNLHNAIKSLRDTPAIQPKLFWIDQISINQNDKAEKGHQVELMGNIYRNAERAITYLGPHARDIDLENRALDLLDRIFRHFEPNYQYLGSPSDLYNFPPHALAEFPVSEMPHDISEEDAAWPVLINIVYSAWLRRLWMVQENILCPKTIMLRGTLELEWISVASIVVLFHVNLLPTRILKNEWTRLGLNGSYRSAGINMLLTWGKRWAHVYKQNSNVQLDTLSTNLDYYQQLDCQDPRDRVYALLGISACTHDLNISPNYKSSAQELYLYISIQMYLVQQNLALLHVISGNTVGDDMYNLPSWSYKGLPNIEKGLATHVSHPAQLRFEEQNRVLVIRGHVIAKLVFVPTESELAIANLDRFSNNLAPGELHVLQIIAIMLEKIRYNPEKLESLINTLALEEGEGPIKKYCQAFNLWSLCRCLVTDLIVGLGYAFERDPGVHDLVNLTLQKLRSLITGPEKGSVGENWSALTEEEDQVGTDILNRINSFHRSVALTDKNQFLNTAVSAREGDLTVLLGSIKYGYILRPVGDRYKYIGTCYADDIIDFNPSDGDEEMWII
jgi:hypothetical protein